MLLTKVRQLKSTDKIINTTNEVKYLGVLKEQIIWWIASRWKDRKMKRKPETLFEGVSSTWCPGKDSTSDQRLGQKVPVRSITRRRNFKTQDGPDGTPPETLDRRIMRRIYHRKVISVSTDDTYHPSIHVPQHSCHRVTMDGVNYLSPDQAQRSHKTNTADRKASRFASCMLYVVINYT